MLYTQKELENMVGMSHSWGSYLLVAPDGTAMYAYLNVFPDMESYYGDSVLKCGIPVAREDLGALYDDFWAQRSEDQPMLDKYHRLYKAKIQAQSQGFFTRVEGNQIIAGNQYGEFYISAQVTDTAQAALVILEPLLAEIEDGATLNVHLGLAGLCPSWSFEEVAKVWIRSGHPRQVLILKSAGELRAEMAKGLGVLEINTMVMHPDPEAVLAALRTTDFPSTKDAIKAINSAIRKVRKASRNK